MVNFLNIKMSEMCDNLNETRVRKIYQEGVVAICTLIQKVIFQTQRKTNYKPYQYKMKWVLGKCMNIGCCKGGDDMEMLEWNIDQ